VEKVLYKAGEELHYGDIAYIKEDGKAYKATGKVDRSFIHILQHVKEGEEFIPFLVNLNPPTFDKYPEAVGQTRYAEKVYIVTSGIYSDYNICGVFSTEEKAEKYAADCEYSRKDHVKVDEYTLDERKERRIYRVFMTKEGEVNNIYPELLPERGKLLRDFGSYDKELCWDVDTEDRERAIKVVNEKRAQIIALNAWGDNDCLKELTNAN